MSEQPDWFSTLGGPEKAPEKAETGPEATKAAPHLNMRSGPSLEDWGTPDWIFDKLDADFRFNLDPCASNAEVAKCDRFFTPEDDGLARRWSGRVFLNPPWSRGTPIRKWTEKAGRELASGRVECVVALLPASVGSHWFCDTVLPYCHGIWFVRGRVSFVDYTGGSKSKGANQANFDSVICVMTPTRRDLSLETIECGVFNPKEASQCPE